MKNTKRLVGVFWLSLLILAGLSSGALNSDDPGVRSTTVMALGALLIMVILLTALVWWVDRKPKLPGGLWSTLRKRAPKGKHRGEQGVFNDLDDRLKK